MSAGRVLRGATGVLAGGLVALLLGLAFAWFVAQRAGTPGPGSGMLVWHALAAVGAVLVQRYADRRAGTPGAVAALGVVAIAAAVLAAFWLA